jgi:uncharacterized repeat protein (TIGR01451 family)
MKPFGVRLAAGAVTILLGAIMAGQAQKNRQSDSDASWTSVSSDISEPPKPIGVMDGESWISTRPPTTVASNPFPEEGAVQLVQHSEPLDQPPPESTNAELPTFAMPEMTLPTFSEPSEAVAVDQVPAGDIAELPAMDLPAIGATGSEATAEAALSLPTMPGADPPQLQLDTQAPAVTVGQPAADDAPPSGPAAKAAAESFASEPGNMLRNGSENGLRSDDMQGQTSFQDQPTQPGVADAADPMLRAIAMPEQPNQPAPPSALERDNGSFPNAADAHAATPSQATLNPGTLNPASLNVGNFGVGNPSAGNFDAGAPSVGALNAAPEANSHPNVRIVGGPAGDQINQPQTPQLQMGQATFGDVQAANNFADPTYNQPTANYGPNVPGNPYGATQPVAPPLQNNPAARIAGLPNNGASDFRPQSFDQPSTAAQINVDPSATMSAPGDRRFEGVQSPSIVIHKRAPAEVKVGKPASFVIHVQNTGSVEAMDVRVHDRVPAGMRLVDASPSPVQQGDVLMWQLGAMRAGDERSVTLQLVPLEEGELGSVARVTFEAAASVRTISTKPELKIVQQAREQVLIGQQLEIDLEISNPGTGAATGVVLQEDVPEGLEHPKGRQLDNVIGTLRPGETRRQVLRLRAVTPGVIENTIHLRGDDGLESTHTVAVEVVSPELQMRLSGPSRRFLERQATYQLDIANTGTADATNVEIACYLDRGFTFVSTDLEGQYDPSRHAVFWSLASLPAGVTGNVPLTLLPVQEGERAIRMEARADLGIVAKNERTVTVDSLAELTFQITDSADPIEIGGETTYEIRLTNSGSKNDSNVRVQLQLPQGVELLSSDADAETNGRGLIAFAPRRELAAGGDMVYRVKARGVGPGTHIIKAVVLSDQSTVPVTKEESTMVYADR